MKVLSLLQPWASLCVHTDENGKAFKQIETRSWNTKYRGELLIHASKKVLKNKPFTYEMNEHLEAIGIIEEWSNLPYGAIIGKVSLVDVYQFRADLPESYAPTKTVDGIIEIDKIWEFTSQELAFGDYSPNRYGWLLSDPILFKEPIPCKGQLSIWNLPNELESIVNIKLK